jgi:hypothetical protein
VRHEVALHVANKPFVEWKKLEECTNRKVQYYTIHGTERRLAKLIWHRGSKSQAEIPNDFPLTSFHNITKTSLDRMRYQFGYEVVLKHSEGWIAQDFVMSIHPEWLFKASKKSQRGPYYDVLKTILEVDGDLESISTRKAFTIRVTRDYKEYHKNINPTDDFFIKLKERGADIFTFIERKWCCPITIPPSSWVKTADNIGLLEIKDYQTWWNAIGKKTRNMVRKAEKDGSKFRLFRRVKCWQRAYGKSTMRLRYGKVALFLTTVNHLNI